MRFKQIEGFYNFLVRSRGIGQADINVIWCVLTACRVHANLLISDGFTYVKKFLYLLPRNISRDVRTSDFENVAINASFLSHRGRIYAIIAIVVMTLGRMYLHTLPKKLLT